MTKKIVIVLLTMILCIGLVACKKDKDSQYTVNFYAQDGKTVVTTMEVSDERITVPEAPKVEGYYFVGWYLDSPDSTLKVDAEFFMRNSANKDRNAYARYAKEYSKLSFYSDGYHVATIDVANEAIVLPEPPPAPHYIFEGWYLEGSDVALTPDYFIHNPAEGNLKAEAKLTRQKYTLTFTFNEQPYACGFYTYEYEYVYELDEDGNPKLDKNGEPILAKDENGNPIIVRDENGEPVLARDKNGNLIIAKDKDGNPILEYKSAIEISDQKIELPVAVPVAEYNSIFDGWYLPNYTVPINADYFVSKAATGNLTVEARYKSAFVFTPISNNTCTITDYIGTDKNVVIPNQIEMRIGNDVWIYTVVSISDNAFKNKDIESFTINGNIQSIGSGAFTGCKKLNSVTINSLIPEDKVGTGLFTGSNAITEIKAPVWVVAQISNKAALVDVIFTMGESIDAGTFENAKNLKNVVFSEDLKAIGSKAFADCSSLTAINIPASVNDIALDAFINCPSVESITVDENNAVYTSGNNANCIVKKDVKALIVGCANTKIYDGINEIADYAFVGCTNLKSVSLPVSINKVAEGAFVGCTNIESITAVSNNYYTTEGNCLIALGEDAEGKSNNRLVLGCQNSVIRRDLDITSISKYAFAGCNKLKSICIPMGVSELETGSFDGCICLETVVMVNPELKFADDIFTNCKNFKYVEIPMEWLDYFRDESIYELNNGDKVIGLVEVTLTSGTEIPDSYFSGWDNLEQVTLPKSVNTIGKKAFAGSEELVSVVIPADSELAVIGSGAFEGCSKFIAIDNGSKSGTFVVPASVNFVGDYAFKGTAIKNLEFVEGCSLAVGYEVFANCRTLKSVAISSTIVSVDFDTFKGCSNIKTVSSPAEFIRAFSYASTAIETLTIINGYVDSEDNCYYIRKMSNLKELVIGADVTSIDNKAFEGCSKLEIIEVDEGNEKYYSVGNCIIQNGRVPTLILGCTETDIPAEVKTIASYAFAQSNITSIIIPKTVARIEAYAFSACRNLASITIQNPTIEIYEKAFDGCNGVKNITVHADAIKYISQVNLKEVVITSGTVVAGAFKDCLTLTTVTILPGVKVEDGAFEGCTNITKLTVPTSVLDKFSVENVVTLTISAVDADVTNEVMSEYKSLKYLIIDADLSEEFEIKDDAFGTTITNATVPAWAVSKMPESLVNLTITSGKVETTEDALFNLPELETLVFEERVTEIGNYAFANCTTLKTVTLPETLTVIGDYAFFGCTELKSMDLSWVVSIGNYAFSGCTALKNISTTTTVEIGDYAFSGCVELISLDLPVVEKIGAGAFFGCISITNVVAPKGAVIGDGAFEGCEALKEATVHANAVKHMPATITKLTVANGKVETTEDALFNLPELETLVFEERVTEIGNYAFANCTTLKTVTLPETLTVIGDYAFFGCTALTSMDLSWVVSIGNYAFSGCVELVSLDLPAVEKIGAGAFSGCTSLTNVVAPKVAVIGDGAFEGCEALEDVTVPALALNYMPATLIKLTVTSGKVEADDGAAVKFPELVTLVFAEDVKEIGNNAFANYTALERVLLSDSVTVIGDKAFYGCEKLADINLSKVEKIGNNALDLCKSLTVLDLTSLKEIGTEVFYKNAFDPITIKKAVIPSFALAEIPFWVENLVIISGEIGSGALQPYTHVLESLTIGANVTYVAADAIKADTVIKEVIVDSNENYEFVDGVNELIDKKNNDAVVWNFPDDSEEA